MNISFMAGDWNFKISKISKMKGSASLNIRKGKKITTYEFEIEFSWDLLTKENVSFANGTV